jgi:hypothetical protein
MEALHSHDNDDPQQRRKARVAGIKLLVGGVLMLPAYFLAAMNTPGPIKTVPTIIAIAATLVCLILGVRALILTRR